MEEDILSSLLKKGGFNLEGAGMEGFNPVMEFLQGADVGGGGGGILSKLSEGGAGSAIGAGVNMASDIISPQKKIDEKFVRQNADAASSLQKEADFENLRGQLGGAAATFGGPVGMVVAAADALGRGVDNATKDKFGVYKSGFGKVADRLLDPVGNIQDLFSGNNQQDRLDARTQFFNTQESNQIAQNKQIGNIVRNTQPQNKAIAYGAKGIKFRTKFTNHGR